ncbi:hypothetical protein H8D36_00090, partial [archaeon]|nr:hypothetical protein [archaeon]
GGGGGGGGGGGSGGSGLNNVPFGAYQQIFGFADLDTAFVSCNENWLCGNWSECPPTEIQTRVCADANGCGTFKKKPAEKKACVYQEDKIKKELEDKEEEKKNPKRELPLQITPPKVVCTKETNPMKNGGMWLFLLILIVVSLRIYLTEKSIEKIRKKKGLSDIKRAKQVFAVKRKAFIFVGLMILFAIVLYLFYVFFYLCEINLTAFWMLLAIVIVMPIIVNRIISALEYHEQKKILRMGALADTHYREIKRLIEIEDDNIVDMEKEIASQIAHLAMREDFRKIMDNYVELDKVYHEIIRLYEDYQEKKIMFKDEEKLVDDIYDLANQDSFVELCEKVPALKSVYDKLLLLYQHFEEKQELYDELTKAEEAVRKKLAKDE